MSAVSVRAVSAQSGSAEAMEGAGFGLRGRLRGAYKKNPSAAQSARGVGFRAFETARKVLPRSPAQSAQSDPTSLARGISNSARSGRAYACRSDGPEQAAGRASWPGSTQWQARIKHLILRTLFPSADQAHLQCNQT